MYFHFCTSMHKRVAFVVTAGFALLDCSAWASPTLVPVAPALDEDTRDDMRDTYAAPQVVKEERWIPGPKPTSVRGARKRVDRIAAKHVPTEVDMTLIRELAAFQHFSTTYGVEIEHVAKNLPVLRERTGVANLNRQQLALMALGVELLKELIKELYPEIELQPEDYIYLALGSEYLDSRAIIGQEVPVLPPRELKDPDPVPVAKRKKLLEDTAETSNKNNEE
ncbi:hypothetical protein PsorP6_002985 [Peronosclerospora sorghi]|uniref:Uncharacterized protein n=1 Tax=Peronosclerospora sorghi TaxID=230839 RepID=A0ACC0VIC2_9STRA|nr:hypothetical protein PsorP6_002985 [Peronosclerospora sorghi]